ncbi:MAG: helix-turn-helix domain-containing protein [Eggerthellaceae bacterium]|nr:helix-turn-helix domain-containing protein [Eggerthellaceae bacterium]
MYEIEIPRQIGQSIKSKRLKKGFTQEQLAKLSNTSRSLVYRLEKGTPNGISLDKLFGILRTLDLELSIIDLDDESKNTGQDTTDSEGHGNHKIKKRPSALTAGKNDSSRNSRAQREKELKAIQNIKVLNAQTNSRG